MDKFLSKYMTFVLVLEIVRFYAGLTELFGPASVHPVRSPVYCRQQSISKILHSITLLKDGQSICILR